MANPLCDCPRRYFEIHEIGSQGRRKIWCSQCHWACRVSRETGIVAELLLGAFRDEIAALKAQIPCNRCKGTGGIEQMVTFMHGPALGRAPCPDCDGTGNIGKVKDG